MINIQGTKEQVIYAEEFIEEFNLDKPQKRFTNVEMKKTGILGEIILCDALGLPRPKGFEFESDGGRDFLVNLGKVDVKTNRRARYPDLDDYGDVNLYQKGHALDFYLFCSLHKYYTILTVCGICPKYFFWRKGKLIKKGQELEIKGVVFTAHQDGYWLQYKEMRQIESLKELKNG